PMPDGLALTGGNMEGKEVRFGIAASALFAVITTAASCGADNAMHDSFTALGGMVPLINIELGEIIVGGVGAGLYGMLMFAGLTGNTPFYNFTGALTVLVVRFLMIIPAMAIAGSLAQKKLVAASSGTFPTTGGLFVGLLVGVILIIGGLTFFPALVLGPAAEHLVPPI